MLGVLSIAILVASPLGLASAQSGSAQGASEYLQVSVSPPQYVTVAFASQANVSVVSVTGGVYVITESNANSTNSVKFEPMDYSVYQLVLSSVSAGANFAYVATQGGSSNAAVSNFSAYGGITLHLTVNSTNRGQGGAAPTPASGGGASVPFSQTALEVMGALAITAGVYLFVLAVRYRPVLSLGGLGLLALGGMEFLGVIPVLGLLAAYLASFASISLGWKIHTRRRK